MARPPKIDDYIVRRIADLFHYADSLPFGQLKDGKEYWVLHSADARLRITSERDIHCGIGLILCELKPEKRAYVLRQVAKVLEGKSGKRPPDDIAKIRAAHSKAKAALGTDADNPYHAKLGNIAVSLMAPRVLALSPLTPICSRPGARALLGFAKG